MNIFKRLSNFFKYILAYRANGNIVESVDIKTLENDIEELEKIDKKDDVILYNQTILSKLYSFEQSISVLEVDYKKEHSVFMQEINSIRQEYIDIMKNSHKDLTFEIDPDLDNKMMIKVIKLEEKIKIFLNQNMKYENISKKLKKLIVKLNILYNAMIFVDESQKVSLQVTNAIEAENSIISEIKSSEYILEDKMLKENLVEYISFADYMISKIMIRNTNTIDEEFISNLGINKDFENTNFYSKCKDFILDEISDLNDLLLFVDNEACSIVIKEKISKLLKSASESESNILFLDIQMWNEFFKLESMILEYIKTNTKDESKAHIKVLDKLKIDVDEKEIFVSPKTNAMLMLSTLNLSVSNEAISLVMKILNTLDDNIRYKEIYFIVLLFNVLEDIISTENDLYKSIKKYVEKYPYSTKDLDRKKQEVKLQQNKEFIPFFKIQDYEIRTISKVLDRLNLEYKIEKDVLFLNLFYFEDLRNVRVSLVANAKNLI